jgi:hypothetical protein
MRRGRVAQADEPSGSAATAVADSDVRAACYKITSAFFPVALHPS